MATLTTWMNNVRVDTLARQANGAHSFRYDEEWLRSLRARPLSLSLLLQYSNITADAVYHYFDNLLPDSPQVRDQIVRRYQARSKQPFDLLAEVGRDSVGVVTLLPPGKETHLRGLRWQTLDEAQLIALLAAYQSGIPLGMITGQDDSRTSVAGAQERTALLRMGRYWCTLQGTMPTTHIIKLPIGEIKQPDATLDLRGSVDNEFLCLALARELGLAVPEAEIITTPRTRALAVTRLDRRWAQEGRVLLRLPQEDLCQALDIPSSMKYEPDGGPGIAAIMAFLPGSSEALKDRADFMKFMAFQWLVGTTDGYVKNFPLSLLSGGSYRLTPLYDTISAPPVLGGTGLHLRDLKLSMELNTTKRRKIEISAIYPRHLLATARAVSFPGEQILAILQEFAGHVPQAIKSARWMLPADFSTYVWRATTENMLKLHVRLQRGLQALQRSRLVVSFAVAPSGCADS